jgi:hypothetical protein
VVNQCSSYQVKPSQALLDRCNQFLGPTQPGVTTPDPTRGGGTAASPAATPATTARRPLDLRQAQTALDYLLGE